ncbi:MFS sugar transporter [Marssonina coronariae]|uniref:MFS sugar transporter n=1 Tax=Diplocarpon coronariae TaxID=2795749 RepID=A0A218ZBB6_9HELO|nr:MFS sugar transporter [Marssonina coronariae]
MPQFASTFGHLSSTVHGLTVSMILIPAALSSFFGGHVANSLGRLKGIALGAAIFGLGGGVEAGSVKLGMLLAGRAVKGVGEGLFLSTSVVYVDSPLFVAEMLGERESFLSQGLEWDYITEISPPRSRGTLASIPQLLITIGVCAGYFTCYGTVSLSSSASWRIPFALQSAIAFAFVLTTLFFLPESPRWLSSRGRHAEALAIWDTLGIDAAEREKILLQDLSGDVPAQVQMKDMMAVFAPRARRQTGLGVFLMAMQQASGIDGVLYYAPLLFASAGLSSSTASFLASGVSAILIFAVTIPAFLFADRWGRTTSAICGGVGQMGCMFVIGGLYASGSVHGERGVGRWVVVVLIYVFAIVFSATWGVGFRVYVSEIQSPETRAGASSLALSANWVVNWIVAFTTPIFLAHSSFGIYFLFGSAALLTVVVCAFWMPETRGRSLEDIDAGFRKVQNREASAESGVGLGKGSVLMAERNDRGKGQADVNVGEVKA